MSLNTRWFPEAILAKPSGRYAHIIALRVTDSYALFQTDGELNTARVQAGLDDQALMTRLALFKRKQTTPERLTGREWLRRYDVLSPELPDDKAKKEADAQGRLICDYNVAFCKQCPDCITYGFAIGDAGSEKSKVITDTAYSLTAYDSSHETFTLNAPYEEGTMSRKGEVTSRINEADHVRPQVIFPAVITVRDVTTALFEYVLSNVLRTRRYGAQTTRTGTLSNHILAIALTDGEIFSNLKFTQALHDALKDSLNPPDPVDITLALAQAGRLIPGLLKADGVAVDQLLMGDQLAATLTGLRERFDDEAGAKALLQAAFADSRAYYHAYVAKASKK
ncbi:MAG: type I-D CRISPR-associated protein Cas7/Csc2 [Thermoflexales bacterium]|nr:type I-D CRISPR-associated protein Cas7/Csc2 [Thermoflexales bacterium]